jgi:uncharacterized repeat protein (TIGR02543 family)
MDMGLNTKVSKRSSLIIVISIIVFVLVAMIGIAAGHVAYENSRQTKITNLSDFTQSAPNIYIYGYTDGKQTVNIGEIIEVSENATFQVLNVKEKVGDTEYNIIDLTGSLDIDVSDDVAKYVTVEVDNKYESTQYMLILVSELNEANTILAHNIAIDGNFLDVYNTTIDYVLPEPSKTYESDICTYDYDFQGWYTTESYEEGTEIDVIPAGSSGLLNLYAKFNTTSLSEGTDGNYYYTMGVYPQTVISSYVYLGKLKIAANAALSSDNGLFTYDLDDDGTEETYYRFQPTNTTNVTSNGYNPSSYYFFEVEPIEWLVLDTGTPVTGSNYQLLTRKIINCDVFVDSNANEIYDDLGDTWQDLIDDYGETFLESIYGPESLWYKSGVKEVTDEMYESGSDWLSADEIATLKSRSYTAYYTDIDTAISSLSLNVIPDEENVTDEKVYCLQYSDMTNTDYGFSLDEDEYDSGRRATVTDFAKANGAYYVTDETYTNVGTYFLRGAGSTYDYTDKRFAYVKYTGAVHCYTTVSWNLRSGIRPTCNATLSF